MVYLILPDSNINKTTITEDMLDDGKYIGRFTGLKVGTYNLVINESDLSDPTLNAYASKQIDVKYGTITGYSLELRDDGKIHCSVSFNTEITENVNIILYKDYTYFEQGNIVKNTDYVEYETDNWTAGHIYTLSVFINGQGQTELKSITIDIPADLNDLLSDNPTFDIQETGLNYSMTLKMGVEATVKIVDESGYVAHSTDFVGKIIEGYSVIQSSMHGKTYTLRLEAGGSSFNLGSVYVPNISGSLSYDGTYFSISIYINENCTGNIYLKYEDEAEPLVSIEKFSKADSPYVRYYTPDGSKTGCYKLLAVIGDVTMKLAERNMIHPSDSMPVK